MQPVTAFIFTILFAMLNGGVLGMMHGDLPVSMRPAALAWRVGTLLVALGCLVLALQQFGPTSVLLTLGNGLLLAGLTAYWRALRAFYGQRPARFDVIPTVLGIVAVWVFSAIWPSFATRVVLVSSMWLTLVTGSLVTLARAKTQRHAASRKVLMGAFAVVAMVMLMRVLYFTFGKGREQTILDGDSWVNALTPLIAGMLPVVGTSTFLLMISEQLRRQWEHAASTDHLTGLSNRRTLTDAGAIRIDQARREQFGLAVAIIDVDHFKSINDRFGHDVGDLALKHVAERLRAACRENDLPARQGGEEFVVIFSRADATQATAAAERIRQQLESTPFVGGPTPLTITASIGLAVMTQPDDDLDALIHRADEALYRAKHAGRNRVVLWSAPAAQPQAVPA